MPAANIKQTLRAWLAERHMASWWTAGTREAMAGALAEIERLERQLAAAVERLHSEGYTAPHEDPPPRCADGSAPCPECRTCFGFHAANCSRRFPRGLGP
jgi:hypothetical protein